MKKITLIFIMLFALFTTVFGINPNKSLVYNDSINKVVCNIPASIKIYEGDTTCFLVRAKGDALAEVSFNLSEDGVLTLDRAVSENYYDINHTGGDITVKIMVPANSNIDISTTRSDLKIVDRKTNTSTYESQNK